MCAALVEASPLRANNDDVILIAIVLVYIRHHWIGKHPLAGTELPAWGLPAMSRRVWAVWRTVASPRHVRIVLYNPCSCCYSMLRSVDTWTGDLFRKPLADVDQVKVKVYSSRRQKSHMQRQWARLARRGRCAGCGPHCPPVSRNNPARDEASGAPRAGRSSACFSGLISGVRVLSPALSGGRRGFRGGVTLSR